MAFSKKKRYPEDQLIRLIRERHPNGARALYDMYGATLYGVIARIIPDEVLSQDVLQEVFIRIWDSFDSYDAAKGRLFTWMINIARRMSIDQLRSKSYRNDLKNQDLAGCEEIMLQTEALYDRADRSLVRQTAGLLKGYEQRIIDLVYFRGYTHVEAAEALKLPLGTVKTKLMRAIKRLREYYRTAEMALAS